MRFLPCCQPVFYCQSTQQNSAPGPRANLPRPSFEPPGSIIRRDDGAHVAPRRFSMSRHMSPAVCECLTASSGSVKISPAHRARLRASLLIRLRCFGRAKARGAIAANNCITFDIGSSFASLRTQMRSRKIATARHCRRVSACVYRAIRDGLPACARKQSGLAGMLTRRHRQRRPQSSSSSRSTAGASSFFIFTQSGERPER